MQPSTANAPQPTLGASVISDTSPVHFGQLSNLRWYSYSERPGAMRLEAGSSLPISLPRDIHQRLVQSDSRFAGGTYV
jgi:hypothetical protein